MDFKNKIIAKFDAEVKPTFEEKYWDVFLQHQEKKKRRPFIFFLYTFSAVILLSSALSLLYFQNANRTELDTLPFYSTQIHEGKAAQGSLLSSSQLIANTNPEKLPKNPGEILQKTKDARPDILIKASLNNNAFETAPEISSPSISIDNQPVDKIIDDRVIASEKDILEKLDERSIILGSAGLENPNGKLPMVTRELQRPIEKLNDRIFPIADVNPPLSRISSIQIKPSSPLWYPTSKTIHIYSGLLFPFHVETVEEQAHHFGVTFYYDLTRRLRLKTGTELARISFRSNMINPALGVESIAVPSDIVTFNNAIVESMDLNWSLGLDALIFSRNSWQAYVGISYLASAEISKEIEYNFWGDDDNDDDDDLAVSIKDAKKYFVPHILKFESGLQYQTRVGGLNLSLAYPYQLSKTKIELLGQLQLNIGFTRRF